MEHAHLLYGETVIVPKNTSFRRYSSARMSYQSSVGSLSTGIAEETKPLGV